MLVTQLTWLCTGGPKKINSSFFILQIWGYFVPSGFYYCVLQFLLKVWVVSPLHTCQHWLRMICSQRMSDRVMKEDRWWRINCCPLELQMTCGGLTFLFPQWLCMKGYLHVSASAKQLLDVMTHKKNCIKESMFLWCANMCKTWYYLFKSLISVLFCAVM